MSRNAFAFSVLPLLFCTWPLLSQSTPPPSGNPPSQTRPARQGNWEPCWQRAGIEKSVMEQRWAVEHDTRSQVEAVCSNSSLTPQQKQQQAREIRQQAKQKIEGMVTPEQEKTLTACQQERGGNHAGNGGGAHEGMGGGCGEWPRGGARSGGSNNSGNGNGGNSNPPPPSSPQN